MLQVIKKMAETRARFSEGAGGKNLYLAAQDGRTARQSAVTFGKGDASPPYARVLQAAGWHGIGLVQVLCDRPKTSRP